MQKIQNTIGVDEIKQAFSRFVPGHAYKIDEIMECVRKSCNLTDEDWKPHTKSRPTTYPRWKDKIQTFLFMMKKKGTVLHSVTDHTYIFL